MCRQTSIGKARDCESVRAKPKAAIRWRFFIGRLAEQERAFPRPGRGVSGPGSCWGAAMVAVVELVAAGFALPVDRAGREYATRHGLGVPLSSLQTGGANAHKASGGQRRTWGRKPCPSSQVFQERCGHGNWRWRRVPCDKWACEPCGVWRLENELVPEIGKAFEWAQSLGQTLKHLVLTYQADDLGAQPTKEGANRRRLDVAHLAQWFRRRGQPFEYLRVAETHKSGMIHLHLLAVMPYVKQSDLSAKWADFARGSFRVFIQAVGIRCPHCWPGRGASQERKRRSMIIPPPGKARCANCGYAPDWGLAESWGEAARACAWEAAKYLTKEAGAAGVVKKLTRSAGWRANCCPPKEESSGSYCGVCEDEHSYEFVGQAGRLESEGFVGIKVATSPVVAYTEAGGLGCGCWGDKMVWRESRADRAHGLYDLLYESGYWPGGGGVRF